VRRSNKSHFSAAGHAYLSLQVPDDTDTAIAALQKRCRVGDSLCLNLATAQISRDHAGVGDDSLGSDLSRHTASHRGDGDHHRIHPIPAAADDLSPGIHGFT
jgi:hypothetical protein